MTDAGNHDQFVLCLRWVDDDLNLHEEFIGLQSVPNIAADTLVAVIRDVLIRIAAQLAVGDNVKRIKLLGNTLDTTYEISKLLKFSPKRDVLFDKLKTTIAPDSPSCRTLCPTRWTVRGACLESVLENWDVLRELWSQSLETKLDPEVKSRITGGRYQKETFGFYFGVQLGNLALRHSDNLSKRIQKPNLSAGDCQSLASLPIKTMQKLCSDDSFDLFRTNVNSKADKLEIGPPELPRKRRRSVRFFFWKC